MSKPSRFTDCGTARVENRLCSNQNHFRFIIVYLGSTSRAGFILIWGVSLKKPMLLFFLCFFSLFFFSFYQASLPYTSRAGFIFIWGVSLTHPMLASFLPGQFLLHIPCWIHLYLWRFSYISYAGFIFYFFLNLGSFSYTFCCWLHSYLGSFYLGSFSYTSHAYFIFLWGVSITHPMLAFCFKLGSFSLFFFFLF